MVVLIRHVNQIVLINMHAGRQPELSRPVSEAAEEKKKLALLIEDLDVVERGIHHIHMPLRIKGDSLGLGKPTETCPNTAELRLELPLPLKKLDTEIPTEVLK